MPEMTVKRAAVVFGSSLMTLNQVIPQAETAFKGVEVALLRVASPRCKHQRALRFAGEVLDAFIMTTNLYEASELTYKTIGEQITANWESVWLHLGFIERVNASDLQDGIRREIARAVSIKVDVPATPPKSTPIPGLIEFEDQDTVSALEHENAVSVAVEMLFGWQEILDVLGRDNERRDRDRIRDLNETTSGPIAFPKLKGGQPQVPKAALVEWWNLQMQAHDDAAEDRRRNDAEIAANISAEHDYGRSGTVLPEISGSKRSRKVTKRRD